MSAEELQRRNKENHTISAGNVGSPLFHWGLPYQVIKSLITKQSTSDSWKYTTRSFCIELLVNRKTCKNCHVEGWNVTFARSDWTDVTHTLVCLGIAWFPLACRIYSFWSVRNDRHPEAALVSTVFKWCWWSAETVSMQLLVLLVVSLKFHSKQRDNSRN